MPFVKRGVGMEQLSKKQKRLIAKVCVGFKDQRILVLDSIIGSAFDRFKVILNRHQVPFEAEEFVFFRDLTLDCPYNTYVNLGLPPSPICIPSAESWKAALEPEENNYYFYVARRDGYHYFSRTYEEHRRNIRRARAE